MSPAECGFGYRTSVFRATSRYVVTDVTFRLEKSKLSLPLRYAELAERLGVKLGGRAGLEEAAKAVIELRKSKGMLLGEGGPDSRSAGSFFVNPVLDEDQMANLLGLAPDIPRYPEALSPPKWKVPAAWLVERAGFPKGYGNDGAAISARHALALTVREGGSTRDLLALAREVRDGVRDKFGVCLVPEPVLIGDHL
jgi:UDP-N-acetylmuramate dehydrogenase